MTTNTTDALARILSVLGDALADRECDGQSQLGGYIFGDVMQDAYHDGLAALAQAEAAQTAEAATPAAKVWTAFCQSASGLGTIWVDSVESETATAAIDLARELCADDWNCEVADVHCLGLAEGDVTIAHWQDLGDD